MNTSKKKKSMSQIKCTLALYSMMIPGIIYLIINNYVPMGGLIIAFKKFNYHDGIFKSAWVGLKNFKFLFKTQDAFIITRNTLLYNAAFIILGTIMSLAIAIMLNEVRSKKAKQVYQTFILIPYLISMVIVSYIVFAFLSSDNGLINNTFLAGSATKINWYTEPKYWPVILVIVYLWKSFGYTSIIYFATVIGIDTSFYEAAVVDGANKWKQIWHVTLPGLKPTIITLTLLSVGRIFYSDFGLFYQVPKNSGPLANVISTIDTYVYKGLTSSPDIGKTAAAGFYQSIVGFVLVLIANYVVRKFDEENALF